MYVAISLFLKFFFPDLISCPLCCSPKVACTALFLFPSPPLLKPATPSQSGKLDLTHFLNEEFGRSGQIMAETHYFQLKPNCNKSNFFSLLPLSTEAHLHIPVRKIGSDPFLK